MVNIPIPHLHEQTTVAGLLGHSGEDGLEGGHNGDLISVPVMK